MACAHWDAAAGGWVADGEVVARSGNGTLCAFSHLTAFGGFVGPTNELGSVEDLFSLDMWAKNLLGLVVVLFLLGSTCVIICWSLCGYLRSLRKHGREVPVAETIQDEMKAQRAAAAAALAAGDDDAEMAAYDALKALQVRAQGTNSKYARSLVASSYSRVSYLRKVSPAPPRQLPPPRRPPRRPLGNHPLGNHPITLSPPSPRPLTAAGGRSRTKSARRRTAAR